MRGKNEGVKRNFEIKMGEKGRFCGKINKKGKDKEGNFIICFSFNIYIYIYISGQRCKKQRFSRKEAARVFHGQGFGAKNWEF